MCIYIYCKCQGVICLKGQILDGIMWHDVKCSKCAYREDKKDKKEK